jgi:hypothetical protein
MPGRVLFVSGLGDLGRLIFIQRLKLLAINDEAGALGHLVVELHGRQVGLVSLPIDSRRSGEFCLLIDGLNQSASYSLAARALGGEQVLQVADGGNVNRAAVEKIVHEAEQFPVSFGY